MDIPVYLFNGFLDCGKTKFIQETLEDERFGVDERTLVLVCEQGETEYNEKKFAVKNVKIEYFEDEEDFTKEKLIALEKSFKPDSVMLEYNGMWTNDKLFSVLPENWMINQVMTFFDSRTFLQYNQNMRQLVYEKISLADLVVFNRFNKTMDKNLFHKAVRGITRRCDILYEGSDGVVERDDILDPLPYDINSDPIIVEDRDYAYFYRDLCEEMKKYDGKRVCFLGQVGKTASMPSDTFLIGRHIMTCCEADIKYSPLVAESKEQVKHKEFLRITAKIVYEKNKIYKGKGPVLKVEKIEREAEPEDKVVTFY